MSMTAPRIARPAHAPSARPALGLAAHLPLLASLALVAVLGGCCAAPDAVHEHRGPRVDAPARELVAFVREGWHVPLRVRVFLSNAESGEALPADQVAREEALCAAQLAEVRTTYAYTAFDFYGVDLRVGACEPEARLTGDDRVLEVRLPAPAADAADEAAPAPLGADALLDALAEGYAWDAAGRWYRGEPERELVAALGRDLGKLDRLEDELRAECRNFEHLAHAVATRARATGADPQLTASEAELARATQFRATLALHRVLNTLGRWRPALADRAFPLREAALAVLYRARIIHEVYLSWMLEVLVGGRPVLAVWEDEWWHRNPLYKVLDGRGKIRVELGGDEASERYGELPEGAVRALLKQRLDLSLASFFDDLDEAVEGFVPPASGPLAAALADSWRRALATRALLETYSVPYLAAWKELWDARLKGALKFPVYHAIAGISRFLGAARPQGGDAAVSPEQLRALEALLRPGDVLLVRQDGFLSNAFLPGFWPHAMLYLGPWERWSALRLPGGGTLAADPVIAAARDAYATPDDGHPRRVIEAISAGVIFSSLEHAVQKDYVLALRPALSEGEIAIAIRRAVTLLGRPYDFDFDFATDDRVVCTELVYRAYDDKLNFRVAADAGARTPAGAGAGAGAGAAAVPGVQSVVGRLTMPANEIARYALYMDQHRAPAPALGYPGQRLQVLRLLDRKGDQAVALDGEAALAVLRESVER